MEATLFVPQGWVAAVALVILVLVEIIQVQVEHLAQLRPDTLVRKQLELARLTQSAGDINPKQQFMLWAKTTRRIGLLKQQVALMEADFSPSPTAQALRKCLSYKALMQVALVFLWFDTPVFHFPAGWFWPLSGLLSLPRHASGTVGIVAWLAACAPVASLCSWGAKRYLRGREQARRVRLGQEDLTSSKKEQ